MRYRGLNLDQDPLQKVFATHLAHPLFCVLLFAPRRGSFYLKRSMGPNQLISSGFSGHQFGEPEGEVAQVLPQLSLSGPMCFLLLYYYLLLSFFIGGVAFRRRPKHSPRRLQWQGKCFSQKWGPTPPWRPWRRRRCLPPPTRQTPSWQPQEPPIERSDWPDKPDMRDVFRDGGLLKGPSASHVVVAKCGGGLCRECAKTAWCASHVLVLPNRITPDEQRRL